jgi:hypothetical protein
MFEISPINFLLDQNLIQPLMRAIHISELYGAGWNRHLQQTIPLLILFGGKKNLAVCGISVIVRSGSGTYLNRILIKVHTCVPCVTKQNHNFCILVPKGRYVAVR